MENSAQILSWQFQCAFWEIMAREWHSIDRFRVDKFYLLMRKFIYSALILLVKQVDNQTIVETWQSMMDVFVLGLPVNVDDYTQSLVKDRIGSANSKAQSEDDQEGTHVEKQRTASDGVRNHVIDSILDELDAVINALASSSSDSRRLAKHLQLVDTLKPFLRLFTEDKLADDTPITSMTRQRVSAGIFEQLVGRELPYNIKALRVWLMAYAGQESVEDGVRRRVYDICKLYDEALQANGSETHLDDPSEEEEENDAWEDASDASSQDERNSPQSVSIMTPAKETFSGCIDLFFKCL